VRSHLESPGKSMGEAAAPGVPWGIPGCGLGQGGSRGAGSEGQLLPRGSALHGPPAAPGSPQARALGRRRAPPAGRPERVSSLCSLLDQRITQALPGTCRETLDCGGPSFPKARASRGLCLCRFRPEIPRDPLGSRSCKVPFPLDSPAILLARGRGLQSNIPHTDSPPSHQIPYSGSLRKESYSAVLPIRSRARLLPLVSLGSAKLYSDKGGRNLGIVELSLDPRGSTVRQIPHFTPIPGGPAHRLSHLQPPPCLHPRPASSRAEK
jgi:hypothetical protein